MKQQFDALLKREMDRKDFLKYSGGIILAAIGVTGMARLLLTGGFGSHPVVTGTKQKADLGYGHSAYGR